jgi:hypothetical protein
MAWDFISDIGFYGFLGLLFSLPLTYLAGAVWRVSQKTATIRLRDNADRWIGAADAGAIGKLLGLAGVSTICLLLGFGAYAANRVGDAAMPITSRVVGHFGDDEVAWSIEQEDGGWRQLRYDFRDLSGIGGDEVEWERAKAAMGRYDVRFFRTAVVLFAIVALAALLDLGRSMFNRQVAEGILPWTERRSRGWYLLAAGVVGMVISQFLWGDREGKFVENMLARYDNLYWSAYCELPPLPEGYPRPRPAEVEQSLEQRRARCLATQPRPADTTRIP